MHTAKNMTTRLRSVDGGSGSRHLGGVLPDRDSLPVETLELAKCISALVAAADRGVRYQVQDSSACSDSLAHASSRAGGSSTWLSMPINDSGAVEGAALLRMRTFAPWVGKRLKALDLTLFTMDPRSSNQAACPPESAGAVTAQAIELACRYAGRFGFKQVHVLTDSLQHNAPLCDGLIRSAQERHPNLTVEAVSAAHMIGQLAAGCVDTRIAVASVNTAAMVHSVVSSLSGTDSLTTSLTVQNGKMVLRSAAIDEQERYPISADVPFSAVVLALADLLIWGGRTNAAMKIINGWCATIEFGTHTKEIDLSQPYSTVVGAKEFTDSLISRFDDRPRNVEANVPSGLAAASNSRNAPRPLRLVASN